MTAKKRGLGRGLEVLLADTAAGENLPQKLVSIDDDTKQQKIAQISINTLQGEHQNLLREAELLKSLMDEFESIVRAGLG